MKIPKSLLAIVSAFNEANIDYRIGGGQAAVFYGLREEAGDWDIAIEQFTPEIQQILEDQNFIEIPDSEGLSWEGPLLIDFIIADGKNYPTLEELGLKQAAFGLRFPKRSMMGYINWKDGESAYQHLKEYETAIKEDIPKEVSDYMQHEPFELAIRQSSDFKQTNSTRRLGVQKMLKTSMRRLIQLASKLEDAELVVQAALIDRMINEEKFVTAEFESEFDTETPADWTSAAREHRRASLVDSILYKVTGLPSATIKFYRSIEPAIKQFNLILDSLAQYDRNSEIYITHLRGIQEKYNNHYDPYNTDHVPTKLRFIRELLRIADIVEANIDKAIKPNLSIDDIVTSMVNKLRDQGYLKEFTSLKKALS